jgi:hypothetical protein
VFRRIRSWAEIKAETLAITVMVLVLGPETTLAALLAGLAGKSAPSPTPSTCEPTSNESAGMPPGQS